MKLVFQTLITRVFELKVRKHVSGFGPDAIFRTDSAGWYARIGDEITLWCGKDKPELESGDEVTLTIERSQKNAPR